MTLNIPQLETTRLILRGPLEADFQAMIAFGASDRGKFIGGRMSQWDVWRSLLAGLGHWALRGYGFWSVDRKDTGQMIGRVGMHLHDSWPEPELGWVIFDGHEGQGYAHEAALAARSYAARHFGLGPVISLIDPENTRSVALAKRLGAAVERRITFFDHPCDVYRHPEGVSI